MNGASNLEQYIILCMYVSRFVVVIIINNIFCDFVVHIHVIICGFRPMRIGPTAIDDFLCRSQTSSLLRLLPITTQLLSVVSLLSV